VQKKQSSLDEKAENSKYLRKEFGFSSFSRSFNLSDTVNTNEIKATYDQGILLISIPKKEEAKPQAPKRVEIN
jgi:HSP20 family protein